MLNYIDNLITNYISTSLDLSSVHVNFLQDLNNVFYTINDSFSKNTVYTAVNSYTASYLDVYYSVYLNGNNGFFFNNYMSTTGAINIYIISLMLTFFKISLFLFLVYTIFFFSNFENYIKQLTANNFLSKFFILHESEKEIGPVDDFFIFAILFLLTLSSFVFISFFVILIHSKVYLWAMGSLLLVATLILTVPTNLFLDFGISFFVYIKGSASSSSLLKEFVFDIISTFTVFIRFVIQNIRFLFIFSAIFELLEWVLAANSNIFIASGNINKFISNVSINDYFFLNKSTNLLLVNSVMFVILYLYYALHLIFLLLMQITIYIGISAWLFFFLYSTKFLNKYEKFFIFKKIN